MLGTTGVHTVYQDDGTTACHDGERVYYIGLRSPGDGCSSIYDPNVLATLIRAVNWDSATNGVVGGGYTIRDISDSYYLTAKPSWFGKLRFPAFDPTKPQSAKITSIPAGYRYVYGVDPPPGR
jgi:hypothetical protein